MSQAGFSEICFTEHEPDLSMQDFMSELLSQGVAYMSLNDVIEHVLWLPSLDDDVLWDVIHQLALEIFLSLDLANWLGAPC